MQIVRFRVEFNCNSRSFGIFPLESSHLLRFVDRMTVESRLIASFVRLGFFFVEAILFFKLLGIRGNRLKGRLIETFVSLKFR